MLNRATILTMTAIASTALLFASPPSSANPPKRQRVELNEAARLRFSETVVGQRLELAMTNVVCDSTLTAAQCLTMIDTLAGTPLKAQMISLSNLDQAFQNIDTSLQAVVARKENEPLWTVLRTLAVQARTIVSEKSRELTTSARKIPPAVAGLYRERGIARIEFRHRVIIAANRMFVQTTVVDLTKSEATLLAPTTRDLVDTSHSLEVSLDKSMQDLEDAVSKH